METINVIQNSILQIFLIIFALTLFLCLLRAIRGPLVADRLVAVNMMGTIVIAMIAILAVALGEGYLADISLIYAMMSFLAVIVLAKIYIGVYEQKRNNFDENDDEEDDKE